MIKGTRNGPEIMLRFLGGTVGEMRASMDSMREVWASIRIESSTLGVDFGSEDSDDVLPAQTPDFLNGGMS